MLWIGYFQGILLPVITPEFNWSFCLLKVLQTPPSSKRTRKRMFLRFTTGREISCYFALGYTLAYFLNWIFHFHFLISFQFPTSLWKFKKGRWEGWWCVCHRWRWKSCPEHVDIKKKKKVNIPPHFKSMILGTELWWQKLLVEHLFLPMGGFLSCQEFMNFI